MIKEEKNKNKATHVLESKIQEPLIISENKFMSYEYSKLFTQEKKVLQNLKKTILMVAGTAAQKLGDQLALEQEVMMNIANMIIEVYMLESALLKTEKLVLKDGAEMHDEKISMCLNYLHHAVEEVRKNGKEALFAI